MLEQNLKKYRISKNEYDSICELLKRPPENLEWAVFSALWSEHCSYKRCVGVCVARHLKGDWAPVS